MFAFFNIGLMELVVLAVIGLIFMGLAVLAVFLLVMRREQPIEPDDNVPAPRPQEPRQPPAPGGGRAGP